MISVKLTDSWALVSTTPALIQLRSHSVFSKVRVYIGETPDNTTFLFDNNHLFDYKLSYKVWAKVDVGEGVAVVKTA